MGVFADWVAGDACPLGDLRVIGPGMPGHERGTPDATQIARRDNGMIKVTWPHRLAVVTAGATMLLIFVGGLVTNTGSALAGPDWPTTFGQPCSCCWPCSLCPA